MSTAKWGEKSKQFLALKIASSCRAFWVERDYLFKFSILITDAFLLSSRFSNVSYWHIWWGFFWWGGGVILEWIHIFCRTVKEDRKHGENKSHPNPLVVWISENVVPKPKSCTRLGRGQTGRNWNQDMLHPASCLFPMWPFVSTIFPCH